MPENISTVLDLVENAGKMKATTVLVAGGDRFEDLKLVESARDHGIINRVILIGRKDQMARAIEESAITISGEDIHATADDRETGEATVELLNKETIDIVLKGNISTPVINRAMLQLDKTSTKSLVTLFDAHMLMGGKPVIVTDAGFTTVCTVERLIDIINNAVEVMRTVTKIKKPRVAFLSANEKQVPSLESTRIGLELAQMKWEYAVVSGPLSFDLATDPDSVRLKGMPDVPNADKVAGQADILVCPGIDSANILYKMITMLSKYGLASMAGITMGFPIPYIILSRSDTVETKLASIALCSVYSQNKQNSITGDHT